MAVITFHFHHEDSQPQYIKAAKLGYSNADADWTGNFVGDLMWTVEPFMILSSPIILKYMTTQGEGKKVKTD